MLLPPPLAAYVAAFLITPAADYATMVATLRRHAACCYCQDILHMKCRYIR